MSEQEEYVTQSVDMAIVTRAEYDLWFGAYKKIQFLRERKETGGDNWHNFVEWDILDNNVEGEK